MFNCYYFNRTWGLELYGFYITRAGQVCRYGQRYGKHMRGTCSAQDLFVACFETAAEIGQLDPDTLAEKAALADAAARGPIAAGPQVSADTGLTAFLAYTVVGDAPKETILKLTGDEEASNQAAEAATLIDWLNTYWTEITSAHWSEIETEMRDVRSSP
jgi:hypothetical protein